jgi:hypothetical protein
MLSCPRVGVLLDIDTSMQSCPSIVTAVVIEVSLTVKPEPTIVIAVPPAVLPVFGVMELIMGSGKLLVLAVAV